MRAELAPDIRDDLPARFLKAIQATPIKHSEAIFAQLGRSAPIPLYDAVFEYGDLLTFANYKKHAAASLELIRQLRKVLASLCIDYIDADLYILDEFQRFRDLIDEESNSEAATIARQIFKKPNTKILLLSATPFKAYTGDTEALTAAKNTTRSFGRSSPSCWRTTAKPSKSTKPTGRRCSSNC